MTRAQILAQGVQAYPRLAPASDTGQLYHIPANAAGSAAVAVRPVNSVLPDPVTAAYQAATGIGDARALAISQFLAGIGTLGLTGNLVDGGICRADSQPASGNTLQSLFGLSNIVLLNAPTRHRNGIKFNNSADTSPTVPQYGRGRFPYQTGDITAITAGFRYSTSEIAMSRCGFQLQRPQYYPEAGVYAAARSLFMRDEAANFIAYTYSETAGTFIPLGVPARGVACSVYRPLVLRNLATAGAGSLSATCRTSTSATTNTVVSTTGHGAIAMGEILLGCGSDSGVIPKGYYDGLIPFWLLFNKSLTVPEADGVLLLIDQYLHPKCRIIAEGDSMASTSMGICRYLRDTSGFFGANIDLVDVSHTYNMPPILADWTNNTGFITPTIGNTPFPFPVIAVNWFGHHETEVWTSSLAMTGGVLAEALASYNNMKAIWANQKARGMTTVALTVNPTVNFAQHESDLGAETKRRAINTMMRADNLLTGPARVFDYFLDTEALFLAACGMSALPAANTSSTSTLWTFNWPTLANPTYFDTGHVHMTAAGALLVTALYGVMAGIVP